MPIPNGNLFGIPCIFKQQLHAGQPGSSIPPSPFLFYRGHGSSECVSKKTTQFPSYGPCFWEILFFIWVVCGFLTPAMACFTHIMLLEAVFTIRKPYRLQPIWSEISGYFCLQRTSLPQLAVCFISAIWPFAGNFPCASCSFANCSFPIFYSPTSFLIFGFGLWIDSCFIEF